MFVRGSESYWSVIIHGGCTTVFSLSGHREDSDSGCFGFSGSGDYKWSYWAECYWELKKDSFVCTFAYVQHLALSILIFLELAELL